LGRLREHGVLVHLPGAGYCERASAAIEAASVSPQSTAGGFPDDGDRINRLAGCVHVLHHGVDIAIVGSGKMRRLKPPGYVREIGRCGGEVP
jgi:hypothetical protein